MGARPGLDAFAEMASTMRAAGVRRVEIDEDGGTTVSLSPRPAMEDDGPVTLAPTRDTEPCPPPEASSETRLVVIPRMDTEPAGAWPIDGPHPEMMPDSEPTSDRIAREYNWLREREQLCAGARVEPAPVFFEEHMRVMRAGQKAR